VNTPSSRAQRFDSLPRLTYVNALFIIGTLGTLITPAMLEGWAQLRWSPTQLGAVAAIELAGLALGSLSGLYWQTRWLWRQVALPSLLVCIAANAGCVVVKDFAVVCILRALVGLFGGLLSALYSAVLANARSPGHIIAVTTFIQIGVEAAFMLSTTSVFARLGESGLFILMAALFAALIPFLSFLPPAWPTSSATGQVALPEVRGSRRAYPLLISFIPFIVVQTGVFTFLGEFGRAAAKLSVDVTLHAIGISVVLSSLGSVIAYVLNDRIGLRVPIGGSILLMMGSLLGMVMGSHSATLFTIYISLLQITYVFLNCYLYSALIDANNMLVPAATPFSTLGSVIGASAMGYLLDRGGVMTALEFSLASMLMTAALTMPFLRPHATGRPQPAITS
jgi:predicted MFS family arabinose efflux permease